MKLTQYIREAFVNAAIADVPQVDYRQQAIDFAVKSAADMLPHRVRALWDDPGLRKYVSTSIVKGDHWVRVPGIDGVDVDLGLTDTAEVKRLFDLEREQRDKRTDLARSLMSVARSCNTRKQLADRLPQFEKYLPPEDVKPSRTVPVLVDVVAAFTEAGWPKEKAA